MSVRGKKSARRPLLRERSERGGGSAQGSTCRARTLCRELYLTWLLYVRTFKDSQSALYTPCATGQALACGGSAPTKRKQSTEHTARLPPLGQHTTFFAGSKLLQQNTYVEHESGSPNHWFHDGSSIFRLSARRGSWPALLHRTRCLLLLLLLLLLSLT